MVQNTFSKWFIIKNGDSIIQWKIELNYDKSLFEFYRTVPIYSLSNQVKVISLVSCLEILDFQ